jgi:uncharacterized delta-60 repeat protein
MPIRTQHLLFSVLWLSCGISIASAATSPAITYLDMSRSRPTAIRAGVDEVVRIRVVGSGCRIPALDSQPTVAGGIVEFTLVISYGCFATPPGFFWTADVGPLPEGLYAVNFYTEHGLSDGTTAGDTTLAVTRTLIVGPRPDAFALATPGTPDRSFGTDGVLHIPFGDIPFVALGMQSDGRVLVSPPTVGLLAVGAIDGTFAVDGILTPDFFARAVTLAANDEILIAGSYDRITVAHYSSSGALISENVPDVHALSGNTLLPAATSGTAIAARADGRFVAAGWAADPGATCARAYWFVLQFEANGVVDATFAHAGVFVGPFAGCIDYIVAADDGGLWLLGNKADMFPPSSAGFLFKLTAAGQADASFGQGGALFGTFARSRPIQQQDGKIVVGGSDFSLLRFGRDGSVDATFGNQGVLSNPTGLPLLLQDFLVQGDAKILLVGAQQVAVDLPPGATATPYRPVLVRYTADGFLDPNFGQDGVASVNVLTYTNGYTPSETMSLLLSAGGKALLALPGTTSGYGTEGLLVYRFLTEADPSIQPVTEYYHLGLDHYFMTAISSEIAALDNGVFPGWVRTGETFNAYANAPPDSMDVCRFFSVAFAPKSSHFYTPDVTECALVKQEPAWLFEGVVFNIPVPDQAGDCPPGSQAVYRLYNNGQGAAPNHRYTTSLDIRSQMVARGWVPEGYGAVGVMMCAPN